MELIIPSTDIPGAIELKLPEFTDRYIAAVWDSKQQDNFSSKLQSFLTVSSEISGENVDQMSISDWDAILAKLLKPENEISEEDKEAESFAKELRSLTINAFKTNEFICENVLAYALSLIHI